MRQFILEQVGMTMSKKLDKIFKNSKKIPIDENTKIVIMSDCHRGSGDIYDNFAKNQNVYEAALTHYYKAGFTYIELGDGDDMWEVKNYKDIIDEHIESFKIIKKFHDSKRLIMIYGNHDICKKSKYFLEKYYYIYDNKVTKEKEELLTNLIVYESIVLNYKNQEIFMLHGHQVDLLNSTFWRLYRFLVRHVWRYLEHIGLKDPTSAAKNYHVTKKTEKKLKKWSTKNNTILIAGHTHRPIFPKTGQGLYFNDGSCVHPNGITCLEIENGKITLVKWRLELKDEKYISVGRKVIAGSVPIIDFYK